VTDVTPDTPAALQVLQLFYANGPWTVQAIEREGGAPLQRTFDEVEELHEFVAEWNGARNLYFSVNPLRSSLGKKAKKQDVAGGCYLHVDVDPRVGEPLLAEQDRILHLLTDKRPDGVPEPTFVIFTGGGYSAFWRLNSPVQMPADADSPEWEAACWEIEGRCKVLASVLGGDHCHNLDRVMRLAGTVNLPDAKKRAKGRADMLAFLVGNSGKRYALSEFKQAPAPTPAESGAPDPSLVAPVHVNTAAVARYDDPAAELAKYDMPEATRERLLAMIVHGRIEGEDKVRDNSRSAWSHDYCCNAHRAGLPDEVIYSFITDKRYKISEHVRAQKGDTRKYALRQIAKAHEAAAAETAGFQTDAKGVVLCNQANIRLALRKLGAEVRHNEFTGRAGCTGVDGVGPELDDAALTRMYLRIDQEFKFRPPIEFFQMVVLDEARRNSYHPVRDYLAGLTWDGTPRIDALLPKYFSAEDTALNRAIGAIVLIAAARRVRQPGCKFDEMLVLESEQGKDKSTALAILAGEWFSDDLPLNADSKTVIERMHGHWIIEAAELKGMRRGDVEQLKAFLSRRHDKARMAYARLPAEVPRQSVIIGTTNHSNYLKDGTGNRRFWPVAVGAIDVEALRRDRDQLWAEAARREAAGESIRLERGLWAAAGEEQEDRRVEDPFYERLEAALGELEGKVSSEDVWTLLGVLPGQARTQDLNERRGAAMRRLGYDRDKLRFTTGRQPEWGYWRGDKRRRITVTSEGIARVVEAF
jgi:hypothetical protein